MNGEEIQPEAYSPKCIYLYDLQLNEIEELTQRGFEHNVVQGKKNNIILINRSPKN